MRNRLAPLIVFMLLTAACSATTTTTSPSGSPDSAGTSETTSTTPTTDSITTSEPPVSGPALSFTDCDDAPEDFGILCDTHFVIQGHFVDAPDDKTLVAGAISRLTEWEPEDSTGAPDEIVCPLPTDAFMPLCEAIAEQAGAEDSAVADVVEEAVAGMLESLGDPNTVYLSPEALESFRIDTSGSVEGIGALVRGEDAADPEGEGCSLLSDTCHMVIVQPLEGSPAEAAGIEAGDFVVAVDGERVEGKLLDEIVAIVRGPAGTEVTLDIERDGEVFSLTVTRAAITVPNVEYEVLDSGAGYLRLFSFASNADEAIREAIVDLQQQGISDFIFDLRSNPGGTLTAAVNIASEFLEDGLVVVTEAPNDRIEYEVRPGGVAIDDEFRLVVLVDRASASASEVLAGALQEAGRATIVGEVTFGKNTVQQQFNLRNGGALKLTIARWLTPEGADLGEGIQPEVLIEIDPDVEYESDPWIDAALEVLGL